MPVTRLRHLAICRLLDRLGFPRVPECTAERLCQIYPSAGEAAMNPRLAEGCGSSSADLCELLARHEPGLAGGLVVLALEGGLEFRGWEETDLAQSAQLLDLVVLLLERGAPAGWTDSSGW
jgi:hypothetical protein